MSADEAQDLFDHNRSEEEQHLGQLKEAARSAEERSSHPEHEMDV